MDTTRSIVPVIEDFITSDPGLPRPNPTQSYWQHVPHPLADTKSSILPETTDIIIIGSGISGASVAKTLLEKSSALKIVIFEARTLCSGATGRNGGQLATNAGETYKDYKERFGSEMAGKIANFTFQTCDRVKKLVEEYAPDESEYRDVTKVRTFLDDATLASMADSIAQMEKDHTNLQDIYTIIDGEAALKVSFLAVPLKTAHQFANKRIKDYGVHGSTGGVTLPAGVMWPYRFITKLFETLLERYPDRLSIETNTPVTDIIYGEDSYTAVTPRGTTVARQIIHCTNGYASHLLPKIRGLLFPVRGTMTVQDLGPNVPNDGAKNSYGFHYVPVYDEETETLADGLWYLTQNAKSGYYFIGGEKATLSDSLTADDTTVSKFGVEELQKVLPKFFDYKNVKTDPLISAWSGIMGFTLDGAPYVGQLPSVATGRAGNGEWITAGFNGYGMPYCWLAGEALASMVLDHGVDDWFPEAFLPTHERLSSDRIRMMAEAIASLQ